MLRPETGADMRRRDFIVALVGVAAMSLPARAQQRVRRIGVLLPTTADDAEFQTFYGAFLQALAQLGWTIGSNLRIDIRWATGNPATIRKHAAELAALAPDVVLTHGGSTVSPMQEATRTIPIVFAVASDPVAAGYADSLARPGGNITGFMTAEYSTAGKWLELLQQIAPAVSRVAVLRDPGVPAGLGQFGAIQTAAAPLNIVITALNVRDLSEIDRRLAAFAQLPNSGLIVSAGSMQQQQRAPIVALVARHKLPAIYFNGTFVSAGGLASFGVDFVDQYRRAAAYVDRILKGEKPGDLPIQMPVKYQTVINLKTAKELGLTLPASLIARADEVIE
jgi:putative ABC transport system substrate-binding protein